jgi:hypothetical protein
VQGRVHHAGVFPGLEDQLCTFAGGSGPKDSSEALKALSDLLESAHARLFVAAAAYTANTSSRRQAAGLAQSAVDDMEGDTRTAKPAAEIRVPAELNGRGNPTARGGVWSAVQVRRVVKRRGSPAALLGGSERAESRVAAREGDGICTVARLDQWVVGRLDAVGHIAWKEQELFCCCRTVGDDFFDR